MTFNFSEVLTRAWKITWKYKVLWLFGMLSSCGSGGSSSNFRSNTQAGDSRLPYEMQQQILDATNRFEAWFSQNTWIIFALIAFTLLLILIQIVVSTIGTIGVIRGAFHADGGAETLGFGTLFRESLGYFWRMIGMGLVVWLPFYILFFGSLITFLFAAIGASRGNTGALGGSLLLFLIGFCCCLIPFILILGLYYLQAERALLVDDLGVFKALQRGWQVFVGNLITLFGMGIFLFIIGLVFGILISLPIFIAVIPVVFKFMDGTIQSWQPLIFAGVFVLIYAPFHWFFSGVMRTFVETTWTLTYLDIRPGLDPVPAAPIEANVQP